MDDRRGVSDLIAFVVVFAVIVTSVGVVYTVGLGSIQEFTDGTQSESATRSFEIATQRLGEIERGNTPAWRGEFNLAGGSVGVRDGSRFDVTVNVSSGTDKTYGFDSQALVYDLERTTLAYEGGALFRRSGEDAAMIDRPPIRCVLNDEGPDRAIVSVVQLTGTEGDRVASGVVEIDARRNETTLLYPTNRTGAASATDAGYVNVSVSGSPNTDAWRQYFERSDGWTGDGPYSCQAETVYVRLVRIDIAL